MEKMEKMIIIRKNWGDRFLWTHTRATKKKNKKKKNKKKRRKVLKEENSVFTVDKDAIVNVTSHIHHP